MLKKFFLFLNMIIMINIINTWKSISLGEDFSLIKNSKNEVYSIGSNLFGCLGIKESIINNHKLKMLYNLTNIDKISAGYAHALALTYKNELFKWGETIIEGSIIKNQEFKIDYYPQEINFFDKKKKIKFINAGNYFSIIVLETDEIFISGSLLNEMYYNSKPKLITSNLIKNKIVKDVAVGFGFFVILFTDNVLVSFGDNEFGQLGDGSTVKFSDGFKLVQNKLFVGKNLKCVKCGKYFCAVLTENGEVFTFGQNKYELKKKKIKKKK
jgi:alpha-tubulin suppressor-like RCC1 family protein